MLLPAMPFHITKCHPCALQIIAWWIINAKAMCWSMEKSLCQSRLLAVSWTSLPVVPSDGKHLKRRMGWITERIMLLLAFHESCKKLCSFIQNMVFRLSFSFLTSERRAVQGFDGHKLTLFVMQSTSHFSQWKTCVHED